MTEVNTNLEERKEKVVDFLKKKQQWVYYLILAVIVWIGGIFVRSANISKLKDVTTGGLTLAPDLDPFYFLRLAKEIIANGTLSAIDTMRYYPVGFNNSMELTMTSYLMVYLYKFLKFFDPSITIEYTAIIYPIIFFSATLIVFFLFVRKVFSEQKNSNIIALIATAFFAVIPGFIHRTVAGVPEKETAAFFFMFLSFYLMASAWKEKKTLNSILFGIGAGLSTGMMGLIWGGSVFVFITIGLTTLLAFFLSKIEDKDIMAYFGWLVPMTIILLFYSRFSVSLFEVTTGGIAYFAGALILFDRCLSKNIKEKIQTRIKLPEKMISFLCLIVLILILAAIVRPELLSKAANELNEKIVRPFAGNRFTVTVAENTKPYLSSWKSSFGTGLFWIFLAGSIWVVYELFRKLDKHKRTVLTTLYALMIFAIIFTRISPESTMNGVTPISNFIFVAGIALFFGALFYFYVKKTEYDLDKDLLFVFVIFFFALFSARSAIRVFYFIYPIAPVMVAFITVRLCEEAFAKKEEKDEFIRYSLKAIAIIIIIILAFPPLYKTGLPINFQGTWFDYEGASLSEVQYASVPNHYTVQWQQAMAWVREETPKDAVFTHWWDYGYWVQSIGERPTVVDGGNAIVYWDYLMGRYGLTAQNETEALEFYNMHNVSYLLIDSSDIGKYPAYSSIGSDENNDRLGWISTFNMNEQVTQEKRNETIYRYDGGTRLDKDFIYDGQRYSKDQAIVAAIFLPIKKAENATLSTDLFEQPSMVLVNQNKQIAVPVNCIYYNGKKVTYDGEGYNGCLYLVPVISGGQLNPIGAGMWISEKLMNSLMVKLYLFNESKYLDVAHVTNDPIVDSLNSEYNLSLRDFVIYESAGLLGPIKIWKVNYPDGLAQRPEYLELDYPEHLSGVK